MEEQIKLSILKILCNEEKDRFGRIMGYTASRHHYQSVYQAINQQYSISESEFKKIAIQMHVDDLVSLDIDEHDGSIKAEQPGLSYLLENENHHPIGF
jgi:hypothetical protein